jgi:ankyrin repeat protein
MLLEAACLHSTYESQLHTASLPQVQRLLDWGAFIGCRDKRGRQPIHFAACHGRLEVLKLLWTTGAELDAETSGVCTSARYFFVGQ